MLQNARVVPEVLRPPSDQVLAFELQAKGVQIYECRAAKDDPHRFEWAFKAPLADLFDGTGKQVGTHYGGPTWEGADGSKVLGTVLAKTESPASGAIPWLLLAVKFNSDDGLFSQVKSVQRLDTSGGAAPAVASAAQAGQELRVPYTAIYAFYVSRP
ncbi:MAG TPA: DUF3455 domain-containing protein [Geothrix sp.]